MYFIFILFILSFRFGRGTFQDSQRLIVADEEPVLWESLRYSHTLHKVDINNNQNNIKIINQGIQYKKKFNS